MKDRLKKDWFLRDGFQMVIKRNGNLLFFGKENLELTLVEEESRKIFALLKNGVSEFEIKNEPVIKKILDQKLLTRRIENPYAGYSNEKNFEYLNWVYSDEIRCEKILNNFADKKIAIFGCGGTGANIAHHLLAMGFKTFLLVDGDKVQRSNLNRQLPFSLSDAGQYKVHCLSRSLRDKNENVKIDTCISWIENEQNIIDIAEKFKEVDFLICCFDQPPVLSHLYITRASIFLDIPVHFGGVGIKEGTWGPLLSDKEKKIEYERYLEKLSQMYDVGSLSTVSGSISSTNMMIASAMAHDIFLFEQGENPLTSGKKMRLHFPSLEKSEVLTL